MRPTQEFKHAYGSLTDAELAARFRMTVEEVADLALRLNLGKDKRKFPGRTMPRWRDHEVAMLRQLYPDSPNEEIARRLGRTTSAVVGQAHRLQLEKTADRLRTMGAENAKQRWEAE